MTRKTALVIVLCMFLGGLHALYEGNWAKASWFSIALFGNLILGELTELRKEIKKWPRE